MQFEQAFAARLGAPFASAVSSGTAGLHLALRAAGVRNYTIFRDGNSVFGYFEADDLDFAATFLEGEEVNHRWQNAMAGLLEERVPDGGPPALEQIFRLE